MYIPAPATASVTTPTSPLPPVILNPSMEKSSLGRGLPPDPKITALRPNPVASITVLVAPAPTTWISGKMKMRSRYRPAATLTVADVALPAAISESAWLIPPWMVLKGAEDEPQPLVQVLAAST